ncbi:MAG: phosphoenolpyruvate--protein phosphotransferase [Planctomycetes bacterium]|nr:phosphoenolpyruvate--protein phosphotransferase [Planctomycetota bacterium]
MSDKPPIVEPAAEPEAKERGGVTLKGTPVAPGLALGVVHRKDYDLNKAVPQRVPLEQVERELNRFHKALSDSKGQIESLKGRLTGKIPLEHVRILDTHLAYLKDSVFLSDVENLILNEQMALEASIGKVIADFDRIFRLVQNETLRERAVDLRDVGIRVLRNLEARAEGDKATAVSPVEDYILAARELSIVDMFNLANDHVLGIVTEEGGLTSHAAIIARSMRIPTLTGVAGLLEKVREGDFVILDATEGMLRVNPDELVRSQYSRSGKEKESTPEQPAVAGLARRQAKTRDGMAITVSASSGNLPEVDAAAKAGFPSIGLYRTELLYLIDRDQPSLESLVAHYTSVVEHARGVPVTFRLLHADSSLEVPYLHDARELNPGLGRAGVRILLARETVLRRQLQALMRSIPAGSETPLSIAVPFVTDCGDLRRIKEILFEERYALRKSGVSFQDQVELGAVIETPVAALGARDLAREADFVMVSLDSLQQYLLAADRENHELRAAFDSIHPFVLRALTSITEACEQSARPLSVFGVTATLPANLAFLLGVGVRQFCVAPVGLDDFLEVLERIDSRQARRAAGVASRASCAAETQTLVDNYRHGFARS